MNKRLMLFRMVGAAVVRRKLRIAIAFAAVVIGAAVFSGLAGLYLDFGQKMGRELRTYGANLVMTPAAPETRPYVSTDDVARAASMIDGTRLIGYVPYLYGVVEVESRQVVIVGTDLDGLATVFPSWKITGTVPRDTSHGLAVIGENAASLLGLSQDGRITLMGPDTGVELEIPVFAILVTGTAEDNQVFLDIESAASLLGVQDAASLAYFNVQADASELEDLGRSIQRDVPGVSVKAIRQVSQSESLVLDKIKGLIFLAAGVILLLTAVCVGVTMMNGVMERRREIGLRKALGADSRDILAEFLAEAGLVGFAGALAGWGIGLLLLQALTRAVFETGAGFRWEILPLTLILTALLAVIAAIIPARAAAAVRPATTLRGD